MRPGRRSFSSIHLNTVTTEQNVIAMIDTVERIIASAEGYVIAAVIQNPHCWRLIYVF
jgi:hypothetical protein